MATRNLFSIILKVIGILMIDEIILSAAQLVSVFFAWGAYEQPLSVLFGLLPVLVYCLVFYLLVFKTDIVIDKLKLDKDTDHPDFSFFKEELPGSISLKPLLTLAVLITSMYIFITEIPALFRLLFVTYQERRNYTEGADQNNWSYIILSIGKILIAYILLNACEPIVNFIDRKRSKAENQQ